MEMFAYYFMRIATGLGVIILVIGAATAAARSRQLPIGFQLIGAICILVSHAMSWLQLTHLEGQRIAPAWVWRCEEILVGSGLLIFASGYAWLWLTRRPNGAK